MKPWKKMETKKKMGSTFLVKKVLRKKERKDKEETNVTKLMCGLMGK